MAITMIDLYPDFYLGVDLGCIDGGIQASTLINLDLDLYFGPGFMLVFGGLGLHFCYHH